jgi:hypothetical protein
MNRTYLGIFFAGMSLGAPLCMSLLYLQARVFCWRRRRQAQREAKRLAELRIAQERERQSALFETIRKLEREIGSSKAYARAPLGPVSGPFAVRVQDSRELALIFRTALIELRSTDKRRFFPGDIFPEVVN